MASTASSDWARVAATTITNYIRQETDLTLRNRKLAALLKARGRMKFNMDGDDVQWTVEYRQIPMRGMAAGNTRQFPQQNLWQTAKLPWRGYYLADSIGEFELLKNRGKSRIVDVFGGMAKRTMKSAKEQFGQEFYQDGNLPGNSNRLHGSESFLSCANAAGKAVATPNDSFAGLNTAPGAYGGTWSGDWPTTGIGPTQYDFWSPIIVNYTSSFWGVGSPTWATTCKFALRYLIIKTKRSKSTEGTTDVVITDDEMYRLFLEAIDPKERIISSKATGLTALGFSDVTNYDGCDITSEFGIPPGVGYSFNLSELELRSMQDDIWVPDGPHYDEGTAAWRFLIKFYGNMCWTPRYFGALKAVA